MKKMTGLVRLAVVSGIISCSNQPAETKKEVIIMPAPAPKKEPAKVETKPTSITLDKNGVKVETKKIKVDIKPH